MKKIFLIIIIGILFSFEIGFAGKFSHQPTSKTNNYDYNNDILNNNNIFYYSIVKKNRDTTKNTATSDSVTKENKAKDELKKVVDARRFKIMYTTITIISLVILLAVLLNRRYNNDH